MKIAELEKVYQKCLQDGKFREKNNVDIDLIVSLKSTAELGFAFIMEKAKDIPKKSNYWTFVFRDYYESLRGIIEALLLFDKIEAENHQCKNAYLCHEHPELDIEWEFLETIRLMRNAVNYRGKFITYDIWKKFELKIHICFNSLKKAIDKKLENYI